MALFFKGISTQQGLSVLLFFLCSGSALSLSGTVTYLFRQLGLFEEFKEATLLSEQVRGYDHDCKLLYTMDFRQGVPM